VYVQGAAVKRDPTTKIAIPPRFLGEFLYFFASLETEMNTLQRSYKIHHFTLTVSPHYLVKLRTTKNELNMPVILMRS